ncbi:MAG: PAS domain S-box protein [Sedimentisphaerales bacterium]|nr:PAS domain S-box protein [Sedimentisphaerales bacterium]
MSNKKYVVLMAVILSLACLLSSTGAVFIFHYTSSQIDSEETVFSLGDAAIAALGLTVVIVFVSTLILKRVIDPVFERMHTDELMDQAKFPSENPDPVLRIAGDGKVLYANAAAEQVLLSWNTTVGQAVPPQWLALIKNALRKGASMVHEEQVEGNILSFVIAPMVEAGYVNLYGRDVTELRRATEALLSKEQFLNRIIDQSPFAMWIADAQGVLQRANPALKKMLNVTDQQIVGIYNVLEDPVVEKQGFIPLIRSAFEEGKTVSFTCSWSGADIPFWNFEHARSVEIEATMFPIHNPEGELTNVVLQWIDITKRKQAEEALRHSEQRLRWALQGAGGGVWDWDVAPDKIWWSEEVYELWGVDRDTVLNLDAILALIHEEDRDLFKQTVERSISQHTDYHCEFRIHHKSKGQLWMASYGRAIYDREGQAVRMLGITLDITERKQAEEKLRRQKEFESSLINTAPVIIMVLDKQGRIVRFNSYMEHLSGYHFEEVQGKDWFDTFLVEEDRDQIRKLFLKAIDNIQTHGNVNLIVTKTGRKLDIEWYDKTIKDAQDATVGLLSIGLDITQRKHAEDEIRRLNAELEQRVERRTTELAAANRELESFAYAVSHDLRAPLRAINGFSQAVLDEYSGRLDAEGQDYLRRVCAASERMGVLIEAMLRLSRLTRKQMQYETVDLSAVVSRIAQQLKETEPNRDVTFTISPGVEVVGDSALLDIMLENLIGNAWKFTSGNEKAVIEFGVQEQKGESVYYVRDDGVGFSMEYADKLFAAFQRLHSQAEFSGTGIGLTTVQRIINRHGGRVWAQSEPGKGATFYFTL